MSKITIAPAPSVSDVSLSTLLTDCKLDGPGQLSSSLNSTQSVDESVNTENNSQSEQNPEFMVDPQTVEGLEEVIQNGAIILPATPPYKESYGPYHEYNLDWLKVVMWKTYIDGELGWWYQFSLIDDPPTKCLDISRENIHTSILDRGIWQEQEWYPEELQTARASSGMIVTYPEKRGVLEPAKRTGIIFPHDPFFHQM